MPLWRKWWPMLLIGGGIIGLDQMSKNWVLENLAYGESIIPIQALYPFFRLTHSSNSGAAFGMLPMASGVFLGLSLLISAFLVLIYARSQAQDKLYQVGLSLIVGGALGNALDRVQHGHVVDFFHLTVPSLISNVSNFADHAIVLGVLLLMLDNWRRTRRAQRAASAAHPLQISSQEASSPPSED
ncbi:MAG: signal peptidase II [Anaerolineae bacterium]|nr:signal peptidase II [Anaerolineae bacterium]MDW8173874.1 signal peptidase II [Anaerolineae bacterium]